MLKALRYIKAVTTSGAVSASSLYVIKALTVVVTSDKPQVIVELGAGTGNITRYILKKMHPDSVLYCFEIDKGFICDLKQINDKRFKLIEDSAMEILNHVPEDYADIIISTLPISFFTIDERNQLLGDCNSALNNTGVFKQFLYTYRKSTFNRRFSQVKIKLALNMPPGFLYFCKKRTNTS